MIIAVEAAQHFFHFVERAQDSEQPMPLDHMILAWLRSDAGQNIDRLGGDYTSFLQALILIIADPRGQELLNNSKVLVSLPEVGTNTWQGTEFLARLGPDVFNRLRWRRSLREDSERAA